MENLRHDNWQLTIHSDFLSLKGFDSQYLFSLISIPEFSWYFFFSLQNVIISLEIKPTLYIQAYNGW